MPIHRFFKTQYPLRTRVEGVAFLFLILLISGCGGDETANKPLVETMGDGNPELSPANYFPMTVGSRWIYQNPDSSEWAREIVESEKLGPHRSHFFNYDFPFKDNRSGFLKTPVYGASPNGLSLRVTDDDINEINDVVWQTILQSRDNRDCHSGEDGGWRLGHRFSNGVWQTTKRRNDKALVYLHSYDTRVDSYSRFNLLGFPVVSGYIFEALQIKLIGSHRLVGGYRISSKIHSYEANAVILGSAGQPETVVTPAGAFENCIEIGYEVERLSVNTKGFTTVSNPNRAIPNSPIPEPERLVDLLEANIGEELITLVTNLVPKLGLQTMWLAPGVGPVKIETPNGIAELIDYEIKGNSGE